MDKEKVLAIAKRAAWTFFQAFLAVFIANVTSGMAFADVDWGHLFEVATVAGALSVAKSFMVGVPEVPSVDIHDDDNDDQDKPEPELKEIDEDE
jgi:hypothetical protein